MKYIMLEIKSGELTSFHPIIFSKFFTHKSMASSITNIEEIYQIKPTIRSAGFYNLIRRECSGKSESLKLTSHPDDTDIIRNHEYTHGLVETNT